MRITSKGQVTIPQDIRERLGLLPYSEVEFELDGDSVRVRKARHTTGRGARIIDRARGTATTRLTTDAILALTRK
jgi:AbrB family looped-hinge helix DNA binding protein